jgi:hypothetical protein
MRPDRADQEQDQTREREQPPEAWPEPRGKPDTDEESIEKGKEQLDKVSGN